MGEMKHTPGPWTALRTRRGPIDIFDPRNRDVVTVYGGGVEIEAREANAHLIAAAPDMREALEGIAPFLESLAYPEDPLAVTVRHWAGIARAALSKAEGRSLSSASGQEGGK